MSDKKDKTKTDGGEPQKTPPAKPVPILRKADFRARAGKKPAKGVS